MPEIKFDPVISYGSIISTATVVIGLIAGYVVVKTDVQGAETAIASHDRRITFLESERSKDTRDLTDQRVALNGRLTGLETNMLTLLGVVQEIRHAPGVTH